MESQTFERFQKIIYDNSGIVLAPEKKTLLSSRIQKILRNKAISSEAEYLEIIELDASGEELKVLIEAISTNTTYFWREAEHFNTFASILLDWSKNGKTKFRIWCAAASTGQEPYTLAMEVIENLPKNLDVKILATDVNTHVLRVAKTGFYSNEETSKLPAEKRKRFFKIDPTGETNDLQITEELMQLVTFRQLNLVQFPYKLNGPLDIIFCRNVMIYFDLKTRQKIIDEFYRLIPIGGYLFLSLAESLIGIDHSFKKLTSSVYQKLE
jgi:chemotaxis protein methyltransferase CheR